MISESELVEIRQKADIVDVISEYIPLTRKGKNHVCLCPFHNDKNHPSMVVSKEKQIFNCFSCKTGGNVFTFVSKYENVGFYEAVKIVASRVGISLNTNNSFKSNKNSNLYDIMDYSKKYYLNNINTENGLKARKYLSDRGISSDVIKDFSIGLSLSNKTDLYDFLKSKGYNDDDIKNLGLINLSGIDIYDSFKNRIMIPITNLQNQTVGFTGRIFNDEDEAKYINTRETIIFKKGDVLFNYYNAKNFIREKNQIIIVEGNMDAIKMHAKGIKNVVALMGTFLSNEHIKILKRLNSNIILLLDNDDAGYSATIKNGDLLLENGIICDVVRLSDAKDPDEYVEKFGVDALINNIKQPLNYLDFKINDLKNNKNMDSSKDIALFIKDFMVVINFLDEVTKNILIDKISKDLGIDKSVFVFEKKPEIREYTSSAVVYEKIRKDKYKILSSKIFYYIVSDVKYLKIYKSELNFFSEKIERDLASEIDCFYKKNCDATLADFLTYISSDDTLNMMIMEILNDNALEDVCEENLLEYLLSMKKEIIKRDINNLKIRVKNELDVDKKLKLIDDLTKLKKGSVDYE